MPWTKWLYLTLYSVSTEQNRHKTFSFFFADKYLVSVSKLIAKAYLSQSLLLALYSTGGSKSTSYEQRRLDQNA